MLQQPRCDRLGQLAAWSWSPICFISQIQNSHGWQTCFCLSRNSNDINVGPNTLAALYCTQILTTSSLSRNLLDSLITVETWHIMSYLSFCNMLIVKESWKRVSHEEICFWTASCHHLLLTNWGSGPYQLKLTVTPESPTQHYCLTAFWLCL